MPTIIGISKRMSLALDQQRQDQRRESEHQEHVGDIAAHHIANRKAGLARRDSADGDRQFWGTRGSRDHYEADYQRGDAQARGYGRRSAHQRFTPAMSTTRPRSTRPMSRISTGIA